MRTRTRTPEFIEAANALAAAAGFINPFCTAKADMLYFMNLYDFDGINGKGERMEVAIFEGTATNHERNNERTLDEILRHYWHIRVDVYDGAGNCVEKYNPQHSKDGKIDFVYMLEANLENLFLILREVAKRFNKAN